MGFFDRFKNYANEFKEAYNKNDTKKIQSTLAKWLDSGRIDANFTLAMTILVATRRDKDISEAKELYKTSKKAEAEDKQLYPWYDKTALQLIDSWEKSEKAIQSGYYGNLTCKEFAGVFKELFDEIADAGIDKMTDNMKEIEKLLTDWKSECPDDSNYICAYLAVKGPELSADQIHEYGIRAISNKCCDESLKDYYQGLMLMSLKAHEAMH